MPIPKVMNANNIESLKEAWHLTPLGIEPPHLSAMLAGCSLSIQMTLVSLNKVDVTVIPNAEPGALSISTNRGPLAFSTASGIF